MQLKTIGALIIAIALFAAGYCLGVMVYKPKLADAQARLTQQMADNAMLKAALENQNQAIEDLEMQAKARTAHAQNAVKLAQQKSLEAQTQATALLLQKPAAGVDQCQAASQAFDAALQEERTKK
jgi:hypothetical protein